MSRTNSRKLRTSKTYNSKLTKIKDWHTKREVARKLWSKEKLEKTKPLKPLKWYVEKLKKGKE